MGVVGDNEKVCCEAATAPKILGSEKRQHPIIGETNVFLYLVIIIILIIIIRGDIQVLSTQTNTNFINQFKTYSKPVPQPVSIPVSKSVAKLTSKPISKLVPTPVSKPVPKQSPNQYLNQLLTNFKTNSNYPRVSISCLCLTQRHLMFRSQTAQILVKLVKNSCDIVKIYLDL